MKHVFVLTSLDLIPDNKGAKQKELWPGQPLYFSSLKAAEKAIVNYPENYAFLYSQDGGRELYQFNLDEFQMDSAYPKRLSQRTYSPSGTLTDEMLVSDDEPFPGRPSEKMRHQVGDIVEYPCGSYLAYGIVKDCPPTPEQIGNSQVFDLSDDHYTVIQFPSLEEDYPLAPLTFKPKYEVPSDVRQTLNEALGTYGTRELFSILVTQANYDEDEATGSSEMKE